MGFHLCVARGVEDLRQLGVAVQLRHLPGPAPRRVPPQPRVQQLPGVRALSLIARCTHTGAGWERDVHVQVV